MVMEEKESLDLMPNFGQHSSLGSSASSIGIIRGTSRDVTDQISNNDEEHPLRPISPSPTPPSPSTPSTPLIMIDQSTQSRIRASLHRLFTRQSTSAMSSASSRSQSTSSVSPIKKTNGRRMMTSGQLSDLFRRLDKDGNGELDLEEFTQIISKLQINVSEEFVTKIFHKVNTSQSGTLKLQEFVSAYQLLFTRPSIAATSGNSKANMTLKKPNEVICAIRYGLGSDGKYLYEMYLGTVIDQVDGPIVSIDEKRIYNLENMIPDDQPEDMDYELIENFSANLNELNELITKDSLNNHTKKTKIFWWIDVSMIKVAAHRVDKYIAGFGLPNDSKFRSSFSQYGSCLTKDEKSHIYLGNGLSTLGGVSSLTFFVQAVGVMRIPITHHIPQWLDYAFETYCPVSMKDSIKDYYFKRFAFLFSSPSASTGSQEEVRNSYENAQIIANRLNESEDDFGGDTVQISTGVPKLSFNLLAPSPLAARTVSKYKSPPTWLLSMRDLRKHSPRLKFDDLSIHIISQGHEPCCVLTIREIDPELINKAQKKTSILEDSKTGVLGRIITGLRRKIIKNLTSDGIVSVAGELTDSPAALASILFTLVHAFSMNTLGSLAEWMKLIAAGVDDLAVSKHSEHAKYLGDLIIALCEYVEPTNRLFQNLYQEGADIIREETLQAEEEAEEAAAAEAGKPKFERMESIQSSSDSDSNSDNEREIEYRPPISNNSKQKQRSPLSKGTRNYIKSQPPRRRTGMATEVQLSTTCLPSGIDHLPLSFIYSRLFLGTNSNSLHYLSIILDGDESLEVKGVKYWNEQLKGLNQAALKIKDDIHSSLDEKRNFFSFILTIVTVGLAPLTILTGYWGMNFQNMVELNPHTYPLVPGVGLIWVTIFFVYFTFLVMSVHYRILYSAT